MRLLIFGNTPYEQDVLRIYEIDKNGVLTSQYYYFDDKYISDVSILQKNATKEHLDRLVKSYPNHEHKFVD